MKTRFNKIQFNSQLITKGIFALAAVAIVGTTTAVYGITNATANNTSGYGNTSETAVAASNDFDAAYSAATVTFIDTVADTCIANSQNLLGAQKGQFGDQFVAFTTAYDSSVTTASANFRATVVNAINTGESKDKFIDTFNRAKSEYFNSVDVAKNTFSANVSNLGDNANQAKDAFVGCYNSARDAYNNQIEGIKNTFADRVSNA